MCRGRVVQSNTILLSTPRMKERDFPSSSFALNNHFYDRTFESRCRFTPPTYYSKEASSVDCSCPGVRSASGNSREHLPSLPRGATLTWRSLGAHQFVFAMLLHGFLLAPGTVPQAAALVTKATPSDARLGALLGARSSALYPQDKRMRTLGALLSQDRRCPRSWGLGPGSGLSGLSGPHTALHECCLPGHRRRAAGQGGAGRGAAQMRLVGPLVAHIPHPAAPAWPAGAAGGGGGGAGGGGCRALSRGTQHLHSTTRRGGAARRGAGWDRRPIFSHLLP